MQTALTAGQLTRIGNHPHRTKLYLAVLQPAAIFKARVDDAGIEQGEMAVTYDTVTLGAFGDIVAAMTLLVGSTEGAEDLGKVRVKSATGSVINVAQNADVQWTDDAYLTVVNNYEYWVKSSRIVESGGSLTYYQDYDGGFQGANQPPVPIMGPPAVGFLSGGTVSLDFIGEDSYVTTGASIDTWSWVFPGGTPSTGNSAGTAASPIQITYNTATGHNAEWDSLEITDNDGQVTTGRRPRFIFERTGANAPYSNFEITRWRGDWWSGGWMLALKVFGDAGEDEFPEGALVVLFAEEFWNGTQEEIGGYPGRENIKFVGYIEKETTRENYSLAGRRYVEFRATTIHELMKDRENNTQTLSDVASSSGWPDVVDLTVRLAAYHVMKWCSTVCEITDVYWPDSTLGIEYHEFPLASLFRQVDDYLGSAVFSHACCDKQGALYLKPDPQYLPAADRTGLVTVLDITDYQRDEIVIPHAHQGSTRHVELQGQYYTDRRSIPVISQAPGSAQRQDGRGVTIRGLVLGPQTEANTLAGVVLAERNNLWKGITFKLAGNHSYLDIAQPAYIQHDLAASGNKRELSWTNEKFVVRTILMNFDPKSGELTVDTISDRKDDPLSGITGVYPVKPPDPEPPDPDPPVWPPVIPPPTENPNYAVTLDNTNGCYWTTNGKDSPPTWLARNTGLANTAVLCGMLKRGWKEIQGTSDPESVILIAGGVGFLEISLDAGKEWTDITPAGADIDWDTDPGLTGAITFKALDCPNDDSETFYVVGQAAISNGTVLVLLKTDDLGITFSGTYIANTIGGAITDGYYYYPSKVEGSGAADHKQDVGGGNHYQIEWEHSNLQNATDEADGATLDTQEKHIYNGPDNGYKSSWAFAMDYNAEIEGANAVQMRRAMDAYFGGSHGNVYVTNDAGAVAALMASSDPHSDAGTLGMDHIKSQDNWVGNDNNSSPVAMGWSWAQTALTTFRWVCYTSDDGYNPSQHGTKNMQIDTCRVHPTGAVTPVAGGGVITAYGLAVDLENATRIYITYDDVGTGMQLRCYDADLVTQRTYNLNSNHSVLTAYPRCVWQPTVADFGDLVYVFGSTNPGGGPFGFVGESDDAAVTVTDRSGLLASEGIVVALAAKGDGAGGLTVFYAWTDDPKVFREDGSWNWEEGSVAPPFATAHGAISVGQNDDLTLLMGNTGAAALMAEIASLPYVSYTDITGALPTDGGIVFAEWVI